MLITINHDNLLFSELLNRKLIFKFKGVLLFETDVLKHGIIPHVIIILFDVK